MACCCFQKKADVHSAEVGVPSSSAPPLLQAPSSVQISRAGAGPIVCEPEDLQAVKSWRDRSFETKQKQADTTIEQLQVGTLSPPPPPPQQPPLPFSNAEGDSIELPYEATRAWKQGGNNNQAPDSGSGSAQTSIASTIPNNSNDKKNNNMATLNSVEIDDLSNVSTTFLHDAKKQNAERKKRASLELDVSLPPRGRPGPDEGEIQPPPTFPASDESVKSLKTIEGIAVDELDAIVLAVEERTRSRTPSPSPGGPRIWSPTAVVSPTSSYEQRRTPESFPRRRGREQLQSTIPPSPSSKRKATVRSASPRGRSSDASPLRALRDSPHNILEMRSNDDDGFRKNERFKEFSNEALSDIPSDVETAVRDRYLLACRLLKSTLIQKDAALTLREKDFLQGLVDEEERTPSEAMVTAIQTASVTLLSDPLFRVASANSAGYSTSGSSSTRMTEHTRNSGRALPETDDHRRSKVVAPFARFDGRDYPFRILGIDEVKPTVLTPSLMEALRGFFPYAVAEENFWLKYSLHDGASLISLLDKVRSSQHTILCVETTDGHVFGVFCSSPWRVQRSWFGSGESFLWRLKNPRFQPGTGRSSRTYEFDNEMEVYPYTGHDEFIQYATKKTLAVGGGDWDASETSPYRGEHTGTAFTIDGDLLGGETNSCATFASPRLSGRGSHNNEFEIEALEVWTVTPCNTVAEAENVEMRRLFVEENIRKAHI
jgi:hypothetical protein